MSLRSVGKVLSKRGTSKLLILDNTKHEVDSEKDDEDEANHMVLESDHYESNLSSNQTSQDNGDYTLHHSSLPIVPEYHINIGEGITTIQEDYAVDEQYEYTQNPDTHQTQDHHLESTFAELQRTTEYQMDFTLGHSLQAINEADYGQPSEYSHPYLTSDDNARALDDRQDFIQENVASSEWEEIFDHTNQQTYYYNAVTGETSWECPWT